MDLRLFPLNTVLFPGMRMLCTSSRSGTDHDRECIEEDAPFGVLLIGRQAERWERRGAARRGHGAYPAGRVLEDGRMNIFTMGQERFRIVAINTTQPYLRGEVSVMEQEPATDSAYAALPRARHLFDDYLKTYLALAEQWTRGVYLPDNPADAADYMAARMDIGPDAKQELLAQLDPEARLRRELEILGEVLPDMHGRLVAHLRRKTSGFAVLN
jgi:Lon protease-like protein